MSEKKLKSREISVENAKKGGYNPFLEHLKKKREEDVLLNLNKINLPKYANSDFFKSLVNAYLSDPQYKTLFFTKNNSIITITNSENGSELSFTPKSEEANDIIVKAIECAQILLPFTAKSILCHNNYPNCALEIFVNGSQKYNTLLHLINKNNKNLPSAFNINKEVIEFLCTKVHDLSSSKNLYRIALTGEALSFTLDDTNKEDKISKINTSNCEKVFSPSYLDKNRLILLVSRGEECPPNQPNLKWVTDSLNEDEELIQIASNLVKGIRVRHDHDLYIIKESNDFIYEVKGDFQLDTKKKLNDICQILYEKLTRHEIQEIPLIDIKFIKDIETFKKREKYASIKKKINDLYDLLKQFDESGIEEKKLKKRELIEKHKKMKNISNKNPEKKSISDEIKSIDDYLHLYNNYKLSIKKLNEKKSKLNVAILDKKKFEEEIQSRKMKGHLFNVFGVYCFSFDEKANDSKNELFIQENLLEVAKRSQIDAVSVEKMVVATIYVCYHKTSSLSKEEFESIISNVCEKFSFLISHCSRYKATDKLNLTGQKGLITIDVIYPKFARIIVSEIKKSILGNQLHKFRIPVSIASKKMLLDERNQEIIKNWLHQYNLVSIKFNGENWIGNKEDVCQAYKLLKNIETLPNFIQKVIPIPLFLKKSEIWKIIERHNEKFDVEKWDLDEISNCLLVSNQDIDEANEIINELESKRKPKSENDLLGCIYVCEKKNPSELQMNVYNKDGSCITNHLCTECIMSTLDKNVNCFFEDAFGIDFEALMSEMKEIKPIVITDEEENSNDEIWPKVPIGQLLWNLVNDTKFSDKAKVWLTEMLYTNLHSNKGVVTFCPDHPYIILPRPKADEKLHCSIKECPNILCPKCNEWHIQGKGCTEYMGMRCPVCRAPSVKDGGCNLIKCICGAIWCYKCGVPYNTDKECREHMISEHGSAYD